MTGLAIALILGAGQPITDGAARMGELRQWCPTTPDSPGTTPDVVERCLEALEAIEALDGDDPPERPEALLAVGRTLATADPAAGLMSPLPWECAEVRRKDYEPCRDHARVALAHPAVFQVRGKGNSRTISYGGSHLRELMRRYPRAPEVVESACLLARIDRGEAGWRGAACRRFEARNPPPRCPTKLPLDGDVAAAIIACELEASRSRAEDAIRILTRLGRELETLPSRCGDERLREIGQVRPLVFGYDEPSGSWRYHGLHYQWILRRWPKAQEADDVAWRLATLALGGDGEGWLPGYMNGAYEPLERYAATHPRGRHAAEAVARANRTLAGLFAGVKGRDWWETSPESERQELERYESLGGRLAPVLQASVLEATAPWWERLGDPRRAQKAKARAAELRR
jgi:hypothetical protein